MSRIAPLEPPYDPVVQSHFDRIMRGAPPLMLFRVIAGNARAWDKFRAAGLLDRGPLSLRQREIVIDRTCALTGCEYEWEVRATVLGNAGESCWSHSEQALIAAVDALHARATLSEPEFQALSSHYDEAQILEVMLLSGFYRTVSYFANGLALPLEPNAARFPVTPTVQA